MEDSVEAHVSKPSISLTWDPKIPSFTQNRNTSSEKIQAIPHTSMWMDKSKLIDGLFVPPKDIRKMNKIIRKSIPDTAGSRWCVSCY